MSKLCVGPSVINSKKFKDTQARYDLHESELEQIVHEWINIEGNEESFPTDDFIQSRVEGSPLLEASNEQILLWQRDYSIPKYFDSYEEASNQKAYASKFFGSDSIRILRAENGKYKVVVSQPVKYSDNPSMINTLKRKAYNDIVEFSNRLGFEVKTQEEGDVIVDFANKIINISEVDSHTFNEIQAKVAAVLMPNELRSELLEVGKKYGRGSTEFIYQDILNAIENKDSWLNKEPTLLNKIKKWINSLIQKITKNQSYYESLIDKAAKDVTNPYSQWYRQVIQEGFSQKTLSMEKFKESPLFNVYQALTSLGAALDGSAAVRMQGTLFRKGEEEFHDLDFSKKFDAFSWDVKTELDEFFNNYKSATNNFTNKDAHIYKDLRQQMLDNCTEHLKRSPIYKELSKYYSDIKVKHASKSKELGLLVTLEIDGNPVDIFYGQNPIIHDIEGFKVADFSSSFSAKLIMGRDKDIRDIINFQKFGKQNTLSTNVSSLKNMVEDVNRGRFLMQTEAQKAAEAFNRGLSYGTYTTNYKEVNQGLSSPRYIVSEVNKYNKTHDDKLRFNERTQLVEPVNNPAIDAFDKPIERLVTEKILERKITTEEMLEEGRQRDLVDYPFADMDRGTPYMRGNSETFDNNADKHQYVRLDNDFRNSILQHLRNDVFKGSKLSNSTLENLAKALFDYFDRNGIQVLVVNKPADEASRSICSTASKALNQGVIFFQRQKGDNDYLVLLHELLHLATTDSLSFDSERKYLEETSQANKDLNNYFSAFVAQLENNAQYKYYRSKIMQAKTQEDLNAVPRWALDLYHATESVGEFLSCAISYESVQNELAKININNKSLIERIKDWMVDFVNKLFSIGKINAEVVTKDIVNFLMTTNIDNVQTSMASYMLEPAEFQAYVEQQQNQNADLWNNSLTYKEFQATKAIRTEINAIKQQAIADGTFMKAPNGNPTNLTERQWLQVRTKAFKDWFGDWENNSANASKVVDENGEPLVVYRGTRPDSTVYNTGQFRSKTIFGTQKKVGASRYGKPIALFMNIKNPAMLDYKGKEYNVRVEDEFYTPGLGFTSLDRKAHRAVEMGYDGMIVKNVKDGTDYPIDDYITTNSNQIKSATDNVGTFSSQYNSINRGLTITPIKSVDQKATIKGKYANKFIGFAAGIEGSSTAEYAKQAGDKANVGVYSPEDTIFVSIPGMRGNAEIRHAQQDRTIQEALKALNQGATLITDNETYTNNSSYNEGEKRLAQALKDAGATYSEMTVDGQVLGVWRLQQPIETQKVINASQRKSLDIVKANETAKRAKEIGGIDTLRHPNAQGMHFGNPFTYLPNEVAKGKTSVFQPTIRENVESFEKWLRGTAFQDVEPERRQWIIDQINSGALDNVPLVYYTTGARDAEGWHDYDYDTFPNHAHILLKLINEHIARKNEAMKGNGLPEVKPVKVEVKDLNEHQKRFMEKQTKYLKQNMALEEAGLTTSEISEFAESIGFALSDYITWALEGKMEENGLNEEWVFDAFPEIAPSDPAMRKAELDKIRNMGRREFVEYIGVPTLFNAVQQKYEGWDMNAIDMFMKVDAIKDNWDTVMRQTAITFNDNEDFSLVLVSEDEVKEQKNVENPDVDNYNDSNQESFIEDNGGNALESWQVSENTTDKFTQISKLIKRELSSYLELDAEGNPVINVWGHQKRISLRPSVEQIYNFTEGCRDINEMVSMLESHLGEAPWMTQLLSKLKDTSGKEAMFQSQFYVTFKQSTNVYSKGLTQKGKYVTLPVNRHPALNKVMRSLRTTFELGEHSLFTQKGVDRSGLELLEKNFEIFTNNLQQGGSVEARNASLRTMVQLLVGETESAEVLTDFDNNNITLYTRELATITNALNNIIETLKVEVKKGNNYYNPLNTSQGSNGIYGRLQQVFTPFLKKSESEVSNTAYSNGKTYQTHVTPSWLSLFIERVTAEDGVDYIEQHYGASEFFKLNGTYRNWILKQFMSLPEKERTKMFQHYVEVEFNKKSYMRDMTSSEYMLSIATNYFANQREGIANYPMPMLGNKPSNEFISLPKIGGVFKGVKRSNYYTDSTIGENDVDVFLGEKSDNLEIASRQLPMRLQRIEGKQGGRTGTNLEMWIDNVLIKEAKNNPSKTYKIRLDGFNDDNGLMTQMTMLNFLFERNIPSNIKISEYDLDKVVSQKQIEVIDALMDNFNQELSRIQTVMMREQAGIKKGTQGYIKHWDARGKEFQFLTIFNSYLNNNTEFGRELMNKLNGRPSNTYLIDSEARKILLKDMLQRTDEIMNDWERRGLLQAMMKINGIADNANVAKQQFREMIWNYKMVETNLLQLLAVDKAFFKNEEDLQKRMPQVHAPGARVNKWSDALNGRNNIYSVNCKVSADGLARTAMLNDIEGEAVKSNMLENIKEVFDRKLSTLDPNSEQYRIAKAQYDEIYKNFKEKIVLTDAQAYRSVTGLRKVAHMLGRWDEEKEATYQKIVSGNYDFTDVQALSQVIKPFVFTHIMESTEVADAPIKTMPVPMQNKNSEYLIILADAILQGEKTKRPNLLKVLDRIMEESAYTGRTYDADWNVANQGTYNGKGIDVIQFVSAVKCGEKGALNLTSFMNMEEKQGEVEAYAYMKSMLYQQDAENNTLQSPETYNRNSVREFDFDNWCEQQTVDDHFLEHSQIDGSQKRAIIESDLETVYTDGTPVVYTFMDNGQKKMLNAEMFRTEYEQVYAQKIEYGIQRLADEFNLNLDENGKYSRVDRNIAVSEMLQKEVMNNLSRYGLDMLQAVSLDDNYEFILPLGDPVMYKRIEQLLNSMIKNRINKQMIEGGPVVQVSNFGTTTELSTRFQDRNGNVLPTLKEYQEAHPEKTVEDYKNDVLKNQAGMAYMEVFCSIYDKSLLKFMNKDGIIDVKEIEKKEPELLKLISYRIPTEDKYSILPLKIVGFLPREAGAAIMFPADITLITGSDFDVDKMYLQRKSFYWKMDTKRFKDDANAMLKETFKDMKGKDRADNINMFLDNPEYMKTVDEVQAKLYELYTKNDYSTEIGFPSEGEKYLDNKMIDMTWSVLTNESTLDKMLNPGGFEREKLMGYKVAAFQTGEFENWSDMDNYSVDDLKAIIDKNKKLDLTWIDTQITFYEQNNAASTALGMAAVQKSAHALLESDNIRLNTSLILNSLPERKFNIDFLKDFGVDATEEQLSEFLKLMESGKEDEAKSKYEDIYNVYKNANVIYEVTEDEKGKPVGRHSGTYMKLGNTVIGGNMLVDGRADSNGILIGRTLGEFVAMFADAVKDPVANLMNINSQTMPVITTLIRLGVSFEDAAMFLSQPVIKNALENLNYLNITGNYTTLNKVIDKMIARIDSEINITSSTRIQTEPLTTEEMIIGLKGEATNEIKYKVLNMLKNVMLLSNEMKSITTATRVNSIAAATGPLIIDNYLFQNKLDDFSPYFLDAKGDELNLKDLYDMHPMLSQFAQPFYGHNLVDKVFDYSPVNREFLDKCSKSMPMGRDKIFANRSNLSSFVDFAYSYMAAKANIVESGREKLDYYINKFPSEFIMNNYKAIYPDNAFVQSIYREMQDVGDGTKMQVLSIGYTSLDEAQKQKLRNGWYDLHKENPKLAKDLFNYWFFRGGMTFNPRSAMALLPQQLRSIYYQYTDSKGNQRVLYRDRFEEVDYMTMLRQFFQNNACNYSLVPVKKIDAGDIITISSDIQSLQGQFKNVRSSSGIVYAIKGNSKSELFNVPAFRMENDTKSLYFCIGQKKVNTEEGQEMCYIYEKVSALGNNNKYLEIDMSEIQEAMKVTDITEVETDTEVNPNIESEIDDASKVEEPVDNLDNPETRKIMSDMAENIAKQSSMTEQPMSEAEKVKQIGQSIIQEEQLSINFDDVQENMNKQEQC